MSNMKKQEKLSEVLDYFRKREVNLVVVYVTQGGCPCSAITCASKCSMTGAPGAAAALNTSAATANAG